jgi:hypothetical protein
MLSLKVEAFTYEPFKLFGVFVADGGVCSPDTIPWSEPKNAHAHDAQTCELRFRALLTEGGSELELVRT